MQHADEPPLDCRGERHVASERSNDLRNLVIDECAIRLDQIISERPRVLSVVVMQRNGPVHARRAACATDGGVPRRTRS